MTPDFDGYANRYAQVINEGARASGETYEFIVELRVSRFVKEVSGRCAATAAPMLLDFGCGTGYTVERLALRFPGAILRGFDTSAESVAHAAGRKVSSAEFHHGATVPLPYAANTFDAIYSNGTFHHIAVNERSAWMEELARVLKPAGMLVVFENNPRNPLMMQAMRRTPFDADAIPVSAGQLRAAIDTAGFRTCRPRYYFFFPRWLRWLRFTEKMLEAVPLGAQYFVAAAKG